MLLRTDDDVQVNLTWMSSEDTLSSPLRPASSWRFEVRNAIVAVNKSIFNAREGKEVRDYMPGIGRIGRGCGCHEKQSRSVDGPHNELPCT